MPTVNKKFFERLRRAPDTYPVVWYRVENRQDKTIVLKTITKTGAI